MTASFSFEAGISESRKLCAYNSLPLVRSTASADERDLATCGTARARESLRASGV